MEENINALNMSKEQIQCLYDKNFAENDIFSELLDEAMRNFVSRCIHNGTERNEIKCNVTLDHEAMGLSENEKHRVVSISQECDGIIWCEIEACEEPIEWDDIDVSDRMKIIKEWLPNPYTMDDVIQDIKDWAAQYGDSACLNRLLEIMADQMKIADVNRLSNELWEWEH